jgi:hypothetical protein
MLAAAEQVAKGGPFALRPASDVAAMLVGSDACDAHESEAVSS